MTIVDRIKELCSSKGTNMANLERELGLSKGSISKWSKSSPNSDGLQKVADYFHVSVDYLLGRNENKQIFTDRDEKDIAKTMRKLKEQLMNESSLMFDGELLDQETIELLLQSIEQQERTVKLVNKKYIPKKYR